MNDLDSSFELDVAAWASGQQIQIDVDRARQLVRWATKYAAFHELQMQGTPYLDADSRTEIRLDVDGEDTATLWMAFTPKYEKVFDRLLTMTGKDRTQARVMISTVAYGQIAFVLLRHDGSEIALKIQKAMESAGNPIGLTRIWPFRDSGSLDVPTPAPVSQEMIWLMSAGGQHDMLIGPGMKERAASADV